MSFSSMLEILQKKNKEKIVLLTLGAFYIATGRDAILLNVKLNLKCTCFKNHICKVGIPATSIEKYIEKLNKTKYSYIIYDYHNETCILEEKCKKEGKKNKMTMENKNCLICKGIDKAEDDKYMKALQRLFEVKSKE